LRLFFLSDAPEDSLSGCVSSGTDDSPSARRAIAGIALSPIHLILLTYSLSFADLIMMESSIRSRPEIGSCSSPSHYQRWNAIGMTSSSSRSPSALACSPALGHRTIGTSRRRSPPAVSVQSASRYFRLSPHETLPRSEVAHMNFSYAHA
jgi:hypothetical protein